MQHSLKLEGSSQVKDLPFADYAYPKGAWNGLVLVGEAPGAEEARLGRPFVGRSGQLLDKVLEKAGIDRDQTIIANVFRHQPPENKVDHFFISRKKAAAQHIGIAEEFGKFGSNFCREEYAGDIRHLRAMLGKKKPEMAVALGRTPLWALTGENGLMSRVGHFLPCRLAESLQVMPTYHPSFILRGNWKLQDEWLNHFVKAVKYAL